MRVKNGIGLVPTLLGASVFGLAAGWGIAVARARKREKEKSRGGCDAKVAVPSQVSAKWVVASWPCNLAKMIDKVAPILNEPPETLLAFFLPMSYRESRGNPVACAGSCGDNAARGVFQIRLSSVTNPLGPVDVAKKLLDPKYNFLQALLYRHRLRDYSADPADLLMGDVRAGWRKPSLVDDPWDNPEKAQVIDRYKEDLRTTGFAEMWVTSPGYGPGYSWGPSDDEALTNALATALGV